MKRRPPGFRRLSLEAVSSFNGSSPPMVRGESAGNSSAHASLRRSICLWRCPGGDPASPQCLFETPYRHSCPFSPVDAKPSATRNMLPLPPRPPLWPEPAACKTFRAQLFPCLNEWGSRQNPHKSPLANGDSYQPGFCGTEMAGGHRREAVRRWRGNLQSLGPATGETTAQARKIAFL